MMNIINDDNLGHNLDYEAIDIVTHLETNIKEHYIDHVNRFINLKFELKSRIKEINKKKYM
jgi:hypothetical protein